MLYLWSCLMVPSLARHDEKSKTLLEVLRTWIIAIFNDIIRIVDASV